MKMKARTVVGTRGEEDPLCDHGSEFPTVREGESSARIINGMKKKKVTKNVLQVLPRFLCISV